MLLAGGVIVSLVITGVVIRYKRQDRRDRATLRALTRRLGTTLGKSHVWDLGEANDRFGTGLGG